MCERDRDRHPFCFKGDLIKVEDTNGIEFINVKAQWTYGPLETNGSYALYPVKSKNVLIDNCIAIGASDAGIYVGQSENIIVRKRNENKLSLNFLKIL